MKKKLFIALIAVFVFIPFVKVNALELTQTMIDDACTNSPDTDIGGLVCHIDGEDREITLLSGTHSLSEDVAAYAFQAFDADGNTISRSEAAVFSIVQRSGNDKTVVVSDANSQITGGSLGGLLHSADLEAQGMNAGKAKEALDNMAQALANIFNELNTRPGAYSIDPNNTNKLIDSADDNYIFVGSNGDGTGVTAGNIQLNENLLTDAGIWDIACAFFTKDENVDLNAVGNAQNAAAMLLTRSQKPEEGTANFDLLNGMAIEDFYTSLVGKVAAGGNNMQTLYDTQSEVVESIHNDILANNSVDLNEELVDLVKYQTAYSASAQVFNTCNSCLNVLMNLGN